MAQIGDKPAGRRVLVTGGTGMIGSALCRRLARNGDTVTVIARPGSDRWRLAGITDKLSIVELNLADFERVRRLLVEARPEIVFHLAGTIFNPPILTAADHLNVNVGGTLCLLEGMRGSPGSTFIYTSSAAEYPPGNNLTEDLKPGPVNVYGAMKACASLLIDSYARIYGLHASRAVLFTVYGPAEATHRLVPSTILSVLNGRNLRIHNGAVQRDMLYVDDVVEGLCRMATAELGPGTAINLCSGVGLSVRQIAEEILRLMTSPIAINERPEDTRPDEIMIVSGDNRRAHELLGWQPLWSLEAGLRQTISWFREHGVQYTSGDAN